MSQLTPKFSMNDNVYYLIYTEAEKVFKLTVLKITGIFIKSDRIEYKVSSNNETKTFMIGEDLLKTKIEAMAIIEENA